MPMSSYLGTATFPTIFAQAAGGKKVSPVSMFSPIEDALKSFDTSYCCTAILKASLAPHLARKICLR